MKRRKFIKKTLAASFTAGVVGSSLSFPTLHYQKKSTHGLLFLHSTKQEFLEELFQIFVMKSQEFLKGTLNIRLFHANELVSAFESFDVVQSGTCQMGFGSPYYWAGKSPAISLFIWNSFWYELSRDEFMVL